VSLLEEFDPSRISQCHSSSCCTFSTDSNCKHCVNLLQYSLVQFVTYTVWNYELVTLRVEFWLRVPTYKNSTHDRYRKENSRKKWAPTFTLCWSHLLSAHVLFLCLYIDERPTAAAVGARCSVVVFKQGAPSQIMSAFAPWCLFSWAWPP